MRHGIFLFLVNFPKKWGTRLGTNTTHLHLQSASKVLGNKRNEITLERKKKITPYIWPTQKEVGELRTENASLHRFQKQQREQFEEFINKLKVIESIFEGVRVDAQPTNERLDDLEDSSKSNSLRFEGIAERNRENREQTAEHVGRVVS